MGKRFYLTVGIVAAIALALILLILRARGEFLDHFSPKSWMVWILLLLSSLGTTVLWFKLRDRPRLRQWLVRHIAGNVVLIVGIALVWWTDAPFEIMLAAIAAAFILWVLAFGKFIRESHHGGDPGNSEQ